ncbi:MAG: DNA primase [Bacteroidia bacterium]
MIPQAKIDEILGAAQIQDVVGEVVRLKKRGANLLGLCPFHNEKTPSFTVSPAKGIYKCFGCGKAGNAVNFIMEHDGLGYVESLKTLAEKYGIEWPQTENVNIDEERKIRTEKESLQIFNNWVKSIFENNLWQTEEGQNIGLSYFSERGFRDDIIKKFQLGYSLNQWTHLYDLAIENKFNEDIIIKSGIVKQNEQGKKYDAYRGRVIFPIHGSNGKVIAFAGRQLVKDDKSPKYVNSPETILYHKSNELYGLFFAKNAIRQKDFCYLVEGYTDVISMHQAGVENVVASSGTSLTEMQVRLIKRQTENVTVLYDGDAAGIKASIRGIDMLLEQGLNVKVVLFPDGEDPDSYCKKVGSAEFINYLAHNSRDFILFKVNLLLADSKNDPVKKATVTKEIVESISLIPDSIKRVAFIKECSLLLDMPEQVLITELNKTRSNKLTQEEKSYIVSESPDVLNYEEEIRQNLNDYGQKYQEMYLIKLILLYGDKPYNENINVARHIIETINAEEIDLELESSHLILNEFQKLINENIKFSSNYFIHHQNPVISSIAANAMATPYEYSDKWETRYDILITLPDENYRKDVNECLLHLKLRNIQKLIIQNTKEIADAQQNQNFEGVEIHQYIHKELKQKSTEIANMLGTVVLN